MKPAFRYSLQLFILCSLGLLVLQQPQQLQVEEESKSNRVDVVDDDDDYHQGMDTTRLCYNKIPNSLRGTVCPHQRYMGLTNVLLNIVRCIQLAKDMCQNGTAHLPVMVQHATMHDLFNHTVWKTIRTKYNVTIRFYCDDTVSTQVEVLHAKFNMSSTVNAMRQKSIHNFLTQCDGLVLVPDALSTYYETNVNVTNDMLMELLQHTSNKVATYINAISQGLLVNKSTQITTLHLRFESDVGALLLGGVISEEKQLELLNKVRILDRQIIRYAIIPNKTFTDVWYATGSPLSRRWRFESHIRSGFLYYKRDFMDENTVNKPYNILNVINITNCTGALIDFVIAVLHSNRVIAAGYSSFGNQIANLRCAYNLGETWLYKSSMKMLR
eukprot:PhF_6_TR38714/c0_g1_i2/m.57941